MTRAQDVESRLIDFIAQDVHNPLAFVKSAYPWDKGELTGSAGPRGWQADVLDTIGKHLRNKATRFQPLMISVASGHGIGKSALVSQIIHWGLSTCADCKIVVTASTETQLRTKTWPEVSKWFRLGLNAHWFKVTATAATAIDRPQTWRADAITWSENNTEAFAGLHNKGRRIILIFDEASAVADKVWEVAEGALTDEDTEIIWLAFGNPTKNSGRFRECFGRFMHRWVRRQIDSRTVEGVNKVFLDQQIAEYGEDNDLMRVRIKGEFPRAGSMQFIPSDTVEAARKREPEAKLVDPFIMGVDVARFGDDRTVIVLRRGRDARSIPWHIMSGADTMTVAARVQELALLHRPDAIFIDGGGVGGGVIDRLRMLKLPVIEVQFGGSADRSQMTSSGPLSYANKRAEMWGYMRDWLVGGMIPDSPDLAADLVSVEYGYTTRQGMDAILLEKKSDMKKRGLASPDLADALCFVAGTMIFTPFGEVAIENLKIGDEVITPFGTARIKIKWERETDSLTTVNFSNGAVLCGKGEHKIFTWKNGQTRLDALSLTNEVVTIGQWSKLWRIPSLFGIVGRNIQFKPLVDIIRADKSVTALAFFTAMSGLIISGLSQKVIMSIIRTVTGAITTFPILRLCSINSINESMFENDLNLAISNRHQEKLLPKRPNGMLPLKELHGTDNMQKNNGVMPKQKLNLALSVAMIIRPIWRILSIAVHLVCKKLPLGGISRTVVNAACAIKNSWRTVIERQNIVPVSVRTDTVLPTKVYNLTLDRDNVYYANGILAYNCLTFAYPVMPSNHTMQFTGKPVHMIDYNPYGRQHVAEAFGNGQHQIDYNPFGRR